MKTGFPYRWWRHRALDEREEYILGFDLPVRGLGTADMVVDCGVVKSVSDDGPESDC